jgi:hypothetical protein
MITPVVLTVRTAGLLLLHVPPIVASVSVADEPAHNVPTPAMAPTAGAAFTVTGYDVVTVPQDADML